jgi:2-(1,2-epoxy-1,2-dihydrophenyl)acetyl-CoA isomerase
MTIPTDTDDESLVRVETPVDHVAVLTLNAPKIRNALTAEMRTALRGTLARLAADDSVHVLILTGADGNFCAGGDVRTMGETDPAKIRARMSEVAETAEAVAAFPKPVIAAVGGHAAGAGVSLACLADIVIAEETAQFTFSFLRLALGPDWGLSWSLARRVGATAARGLILSRGVLGATEAHRIGLVDRLTLRESARDEALHLAKELVNGPRQAIAAVKRMLGDLDGLRAALAAEAAMQLERFPSWEHQEGAAAFREKRPPNYDR